MKLLKKIILYVFASIIFIIIVNYLSLLIWGKINLLKIASEDFGYETLNKKVDLVFWAGISSQEEDFGSLSDFSNTEINNFMNTFYNNGLAANVIYKPKIVKADSIKYNKNELNVFVVYKTKYVFYREIDIMAYSPGFITDKTEYLYWFFGWHRFSEPRFGIS